MLFKKFTTLACASLFSCGVFAQDNIPSVTDKIVDTFLECDNQFFQNLSENKELFSEYVDLTTKNDVTYIPVESIYQQDKDKINFKKPLNYRGLTITGYQNIFIPTSLSGQYYYWGFIFDNSQEEILNALSDIKWSNYNDKTYIANPTIYDRNAKPAEWQDNPYAIDGVAPRLATIEKSLYLENINNNQNRIFCSIQGDLTKDLLYKYRPDMKPLDEQMEKEHQEKIDAYKLKKQKEQDEKKAIQEKQLQPNEITENSSKDGDEI
jgi:hypothetical protein